MHPHPKDLRELARTAARTGRIPEELVCYFDQHGKWTGDRRRWPATSVRSTAQIMRRILLPAHRRSRTEHGRRILLTSLICIPKLILTADWHEIRGSVFLGPHSGFAGPFLDTVGGSLTGASADKVNLPQLHTVGGDFEFSAMTRLVQTPLLRHVGRDVHVRGWNPIYLETVGGSFSIRFVLAVGLPVLRQIGGSIHGDYCHEFDAPNLEEIGGSFHLEFRNRAVYLPKLKKIPGNFYVMTAARIIAPQLAEVGGDACTHSAPDFAPSRLRVGGTWHMHAQARTMLTLCQRARELLREGGDLYL